ncbi:MAG TPA: hypothetical protein VNZ49_07895 [Bacteroidia bacterium]|jgi:hypothetical protein|nr:hypothetical protein [Bacteroidia bacterium]
MKKKIVLLSIIIFPSLIYFVFELTQANFKKMAYFGPKTVDAKGDTVYWSVPDVYYWKKVFIKTDSFKDEENSNVTIKMWVGDSTTIDTTNYPVYVLLFLDSKLRNEGYKLDGIYDYLKYKSKDLKDIPIFLVSDVAGATNNFKEGIELKGDFDSLKIKLLNFYPLLIDYENSSRVKFLSETYFKQKPVYVFDYFMMLIDKKRHIRGYYDPTFNAEVKRMIQEYQHLKIRDEYAQTLKQNDIKK